MDDLPSGSPAVLRGLNRARILRTIRSCEAISRADLARETGLSKPTVNLIVAGLIEDGMLQDIEPEPAGTGARPGPRPRLVAFRPGYGYVAGIDIGANKLLVFLADLQGRIVASRRVPARGPRQATALLVEVRQTLETVLVEAHVDLKELQVLSVGTPGVLDPVTNRVARAPQIAGWEGLDLVTTLAAWAPCHVIVDTEDQLSMLAERWQGAGKGVNDLVYINLGMGLGAGILFRGERYRGAGGGAGEIGFLPIGDASAGNRGAHPGLGAFELAAGGIAYARLGSEAARRRGGEGLRARAGGDPDAVDAEVVFAAAGDGDPVAVAIVDELVGRLARGVATVAVILDPSVVIIGGGISRAGAPLLSRLERGVASLMPRPPRLVLSSLGEEAVALGAVIAAIAAWESSAYAASVDGS
jgi:predicted NBD/HSP70 family sugar kinase